MRGPDTPRMALCVGGPKDGDWVTLTFASNVYKVADYADGLHLNPVTGGEPPNLPLFIYRVERFQVQTMVYWLLRPEEWSVERTFACLINGYHREPLRSRQ